MQAPVFQNFTLNCGVERMDLGGKALTNYLKELVSYRSVNVMDESFIMDDVIKLCFVSLDVQRDLKISRRPGYDNIFRCTYVLPDGVTYTKGFVKDPDEAKRHVSLDDGCNTPKLRFIETVLSSERLLLQTETTNLRREGLQCLDVPGKRQGRRKIDLSKNEFSLTNERFLVQEMIFRLADLGYIGMNQAGLAECIVRAVSSCHPQLHPVLYERQHQKYYFDWWQHIISSICSKTREFRPLVPDEYQVKITTQEDPIIGVRRGESLLASSPDFEAMCVCHQGRI